MWRENVEERERDRIKKLKVRRGRRNVRLGRGGKMCKYGVLFLSICCLFNDADSIFGYVMSSDGMISER